MLTKQDLKQIKQIVRDEVTSEAKTTKSTLRAEIKLSRMQIQEDISDLSDRIKNLEQQSQETRKEVKKTNKSLDEFIDFFDKEHLGLAKRVQRVENELHLRPLADF